MQISKEQIKIIHVAKNQLKLSNENYYAMLQGLNAGSSKELSFEDANELIEEFKKLGFKLNSSRINYSQFNGRGKGYATPKQMRKIEAMWMTHPAVKSRDKDSMNKFIKRIAGVDRLEWLRIERVDKVIKAIESL